MVEHYPGMVSQGVARHGCCAFLQLEVLSIHCNDLTPSMLCNLLVNAVLFVCVMFFTAGTEV